MKGFTKENSRPGACAQGVKGSRGQKLGEGQSTSLVLLDTRAVAPSPRPTLTRLECENVEGGPH